MRMGAHGARPGSYRLAICGAWALSACQSANRGTEAAAPKAVAEDAADTVLTGARVYTLGWPEPDREGRPHSAAPYANGRWHPDATTIAIRDGHIVDVGDAKVAQRWTGPATESVDLGGATVVPGLIDSHAHALTLARNLSRVDLQGLNPSQAIERLAARAAEVPTGQWVIGWGFDEGEWTANLPTNDALTAAIPGHPVVAYGLHGFAAWLNGPALAAGGFSHSTRDPIGGRLVRAARGRVLTGMFLDNALDLLEGVVPPATEADLEAALKRALQSLADLGYVEIHEAGVDSAGLQRIVRLAGKAPLPVDVHVMLSASDEALMKAWIARGPAEAASGVRVRAVKGYYDASLGARGARLLADYADAPGHRGVSGEGYGFDEALVVEAIRTGFQVGIHAIGDAGNREVLDFFERAAAEVPGSGDLRHRIEHAQLVHPNDQPRFAELGVIASMEPPHCVEDMAWAEDRIGARASYGYAWRSLRRQGARVVFNSDLPGSDANPFYGLHSAVTRQNRDGKPAGGWFPEQRFTAEEALRAYTIEGAFAGLNEAQAGTLVAGKQANLTILDADILATADAPAEWLGGNVLGTMLRGRWTKPLSGS